MIPTMIGNFETEEWHELGFRFESKTIPGGPPWEDRWGGVHERASTTVSTQVSFPKYTWNPLTLEVDTWEDEHGL